MIAAPTSRCLGDHLRAWALVFGFALLAATSATLPVSAATAEDGADAESSGATPTGVVDLVSQSNYVNADGEFVVILDWSGSPSDDLDVGFTVYAPLGSRSELTTSPGEVLNRTEPTSMALLPRTPEGYLIAQLPIRSFTPGDAQRVWIPDPGVYPVDVDVSSAGAPVASVSTTLIRLPTEVAETDLLPVGLVLEVTAADGLGLLEATQLLADHPDVPVTVYLDSGVLARLGDDLDRTAAFAGALGERPVLSAPRLNLDPSALAEIDQGDLYVDAVEDLWAELEAYGLRPDRTMLPTEAPLTAEGARLLLDMGVDSVLDLDREQNGVGMLRASGPETEGRPSELAVLAPDSTLSAALGPGPQPVLRAHRLLAQLELRAREDRSAVLLGTPRTTDPRSLDVMLSALDELSLLLPVPVDSTLARSLPVRPVERAAQDLAGHAQRITEIRGLLAVYDAYHRTGGDSPEVLQRDLATVLSRDLNPEARDVGLANLSGRLSVAFEEISVPGSQAFTLAAQRSVIPFVIENDSTGTRQVLLRFRTEKVDVLRDGAVVDEILVEVPAGSSSVDLEVEARSVGASPLEVVVLTPGGERELTRTRFQIRSTAIPGLGFVLTGAAFVLLFLWWIRSMRRTRSHSRDQLEGDDHSEEEEIGDVQRGVEERKEMVGSRSASADPSPAVDPPDARVDS